MARICRGRVAVFTADYCIGFRIVAVDCPAYLDDLSAFDRPTAIQPQDAMQSALLGWCIVRQCY